MLDLWMAATTASTIDDDWPCDMATTIDDWRTDLAICSWFASRIYVKCIRRECMESHIFSGVIGLKKYFRENKKDQTLDNDNNETQAS